MLTTGVARRAQRSCRAPRCKSRRQRGLPAARYPGGHFTRVGLASGSARSRRPGADRASSPPAYGGTLCAPLAPCQCHLSPLTAPALTTVNGNVALGGTGLVTRVLVPRDRHHAPDSAGARGLRPASDRNVGPSPRRPGSRPRPGRGAGAVALCRNGPGEWWAGEESNLYSRWRLIHSPSRAVRRRPDQSPIRAQDGPSKRSERRPESGPVRPVCYRLVLPARPVGPASQGKGRGPRPPVGPAGEPRPAEGPADPAAPGRARAGPGPGVRAGERRRASPRMVAATCTRR
jgi:hypothetical protein